MSDYAWEFIKLSKYAQYMMPTEAMKVKRFKAGLVTPLYNALVAMEFPTLSKLVDIAKQLEARHREDREEREQKRQLTGKAQGSNGKIVTESQTVEQVAYQMPPHPRKDKKKKKKQYSRGTLVQSTPMMQITYGGGQMGQRKQTCSNYGKQHSGPCLWGQDVCYKCGKLGHMTKGCRNL